MFKFIFIVLIIFSYVFHLYKKYDAPLKKQYKEGEKRMQEEAFEEECEQKGRTFEEQIAELFANSLPGCKIIRNCILTKKNKNGSYIFLDGMRASKEFDLLVLSSYGLFIVECKNWQNCFIAGDKNNSEWNVSYSKNKKYKVHSPWTQVTEGVSVLKRYFPNLNFNRMVILPNSAKISSNLIDGEHIFRKNELDSYLFQFKKGNADKLYPNKTLYEICNTIQGEDKISREAHIEYVNKIKEISQNKTA